MITFTIAQLTALVASTNFNGTVEEFAAQNGFAIEQPKAARAPKREKGTTNVVAVYSPELGTALYTTNVLFSNRSEEWILAEWRKIVKTSRGDEFRELLAAADVEVHVSEAMAFLTADDKDAVNEALAQTVAHFNQNGYTSITKLKRDVQARVEELCQAQKEESADDVAEEEVAG